MTQPETKRFKWTVCVLLAVAVLGVYSQALHFGFVNYDDSDYVTGNWHVRHGLSWQSFQWAFTSNTSANWHPLTWLSHCLDVTLYGMNAAGHHLTSLLLHAANSILLFLLLCRMTRAPRRSAFVAALFALHPLRVESVVWISERKDVLSAFFFFCTLWAWLRHVENLKSQTPNSGFFYGLSLLFYALGLMSKPMLVTLPFVLLLLDYWPLGRRALVEKIPFFVLAAASSIVTFTVQNRLGIVASMAQFPLGDRLANVPVAYVRYLIHCIFPTHLAAVYPYVHWGAGKVIGSLMVLAAITALAIRRASASPWLMVGWFWFLGMLVPAIGIVQVGAQSMADRYTYLPCIGLAIMAVWAVGEFSFERPFWSDVVAIASPVVVVFFALLAWGHTQIYEDSGALWESTLRNYPECLPAQNNFSLWLMGQGRWDDALAHCKTVLSIRPSDPTAHDYLSRIDLHQNKVDDAIAEALKSIQLQPHSEDNRQTLALAYLKKHDYRAACASLQEAVRINPSSAPAWCNLGYSLLQQGSVSQATAAYLRSLELDPDAPLAHNDLGNILLREKRMDEALLHFQRAVELSPSFAEAHFNIAGILAYRGQLDEAIEQCRKAVDLQPDLEVARQLLTRLLNAKERKSGTH